MPLCTKFNEETDDGRDIKEVSRLLFYVIDSIIDAAALENPTQKRGALENE